MASIMERHSYVIVMDEHDVHVSVDSGGPQNCIWYMAHVLQVMKMKGASKLVEICRKFLAAYIAIYTCPYMP